MLDNPSVFTWYEFLLDCTKTWGLRSPKMIEKETARLNEFFCKKKTPPAYVIVFPIYEPPRYKIMLHSTDEFVERCSKLGLDMFEVLGSRDILYFATNDTDCKDKLFILKLCWNQYDFDQQYLLS
jgi:hypothetical protein